MFCLDTHIDSFKKFGENIEQCKKKKQQATNFLTLK